MKLKRSFSPPKRPQDSRWPVLQTVKLENNSVQLSEFLDHRFAKIPYTFRTDSNPFNPQTLKPVLPRPPEKQFCNAPPPPEKQFCHAPP